MLKINKLSVEREGNLILNKLTLKVGNKEIVALMGKNGSGKSTLAYALMGHPDFKAHGKAVFNGKNILKMKVNERAKSGIFLSFQHPVSIPGVSVSNFLKSAYSSVYGKIMLIEFKKLLEKKCKELHIDYKMLNRSLNEDFSGGEKKKIEILQLALLKPKLAILDETDSGLDLSALKIVAGAIKKENKKGMSILLITHYNRFLEYIKPDKVYLIDKGRIVMNGDYKLALRLEKEGYKILNEK